MSRLTAILLPLLAAPALATGLAAVLATGLPTAPADAAARVTLANPDGDAVVDPTYATTLTVSGRGFQSIQNGHGGIYVLFGVVKGTWQPSKGGTSGSDYLTVPDSQSVENAGYARFVAFPGSDTADSANGGSIAADGTWRTTINVPGGVFTTYATTSAGDQKPVRVDCRVSTCGVITVGAHGVANARNETFTPVRVAALATTSRSTSTTTTRTSGARPTTTTPQAAGTAKPAVAPAAVGPATLEVDRASAQPGRVLAFSAEGLTAGSQVSAVFENGRAAVGPLTVGATGQVAGVLRLPTDLVTGTYELRVVGGTEPVSVRFGVVAPRVPEEASGWWPEAFAITGAVTLAGALLFAALRRKRVRDAV